MNSQRDSRANAADDHGASGVNADADGRGFPDGGWGRGLRRVPAGRRQAAGGLGGDELHRHAEDGEEAIAEILVTMKPPWCSDDGGGDSPSSWLRKSGHFLGRAGLPEYLVKFLRHRRT